MKHLLLGLAGLALVACSNTPTLRYDLPVPPVAERMRVNVRSVEVREVSLPLYAGLETITVMGPEGALLSDPDILWADDPVRGITQGLADTLSRVTTATVAAEPWPLSDDPDVRLDVRFTTALAGADGQFRMAGQYFVASPFGERRDRAGRFDIAVPYDPANTASVAAAKGAAVLQLAKTIAREAL